MNKLLSLVLIITLSTATSCMEAGTHGSIKYYQYPVSKQNLETALSQVMINSSTVHQDSSRGYYNDDTTYITISIVYGKVVYNYIFRYGGDKQHWDTSKESSISIAYANNQTGEGGSVGNGGIKWYDSKLRHKLVDPFEKELVSKIDEKLGVEHIEGE